ncbi:LexA family transcriptional regulator [Ehrlichia minasensis]|uniref:LexA family transcriptional regulator n=1 Tax=Ehrlichia minasensis TaxID=1242993 RepID=A0A4Q6IAV3_9RICK|nr:LexA family transcriptional regulator [Ehrlichia minasensis]RZB12428.1 LexA family transcriptional regulator [Ehrlichia minasensis]CEI84915.1 Transcriptional regulator [Ehrlichia minasensis]
MKTSSDNSMIVTRMKYQMDKMGINARELAHKADVGKSFVYDILSGKSTNPTSKKLMAIAKVLNVSLSYLISDDNYTYGQGNMNILPVYDLELENGKVSSSGDVNLYLSSNINLTSNMKNLRVYYVKGDSMIPTLMNQDIVLVDIGDKIPHPAGLFVIVDTVGVSIRRLEYLKENQKIKLHVVSDNKKYSSYECHLEDMEILGRVIWYARSL